MSLPMAKDEAWYKEGLRFKCTGCGQCCTGSPGYVWVSDQEIISLANHLNLSIPDFSKKYLRIIDGLPYLIEDPVNFDCVFLKENRCSVYEVRPKQCRTFPWWTTNLETRQDWEEAAKGCEGINLPDAPLVPFETIEEQRVLEAEY